MKMCPNCRNQIPDEAVYCPICGTGVGTGPQFAPQQSSVPDTGYTEPPVYAAVVPYVDPYDHTAEFDAADIAENKLFAMAMYLLGPLGMIIAMLAVQDSRYTAFHVRQALKLTVAEILGILVLVVAAFLMWSLRMRVFMVFVIAVAIIGLVAIHLLCVLQVIRSKAKEVYLVRNLRFLK